MAFKTRLKISFNFLLWAILLICSINYNSVIYVFYQAKGQANILLNLQTFEEFENKHSGKQTESLQLISRIKQYSVDSLSFKVTGNFTKIYNQNNQPSLWVISASDKFKIEPYYWSFPIVGKVSYKGFFDKKKAVIEKNHLLSEGYDVDMRSVSAWSTLGWFSDPVLSNMLDKSKGSLCNLIFHELFHATYYAPSSVEFNENLASFIAHKATIRFLAEDTLSLNEYLKSYSDNARIDHQLNLEVKGLEMFYDSISGFSNNRKTILKLKKLNQICSNLERLNVTNKAKISNMKNQILSSKNAWIVDFEQYNSLQDSLEEVFNKNYNSDLNKMVQSLK